MPNGNTLICEGNPGHLFEITGNVSWEYITAYNQFGAVNQGDNPFGNSTFRAYRYAPDYPGLAGRDLTPGPVVENNPLPLDCELHPAPIDTTAQNVQQPNAGLPLRSEPRLNHLGCGRCTRPCAAPFGMSPAASSGRFPVWPEATPTPRHRFPTGCIG